MALDNTRSSMSWGGMVVAAILGLLVGYVACQMTESDMPDQSASTVKKEAVSTAKADEPAMPPAAIAPKIDTKAADLRLMINALDRQHVGLVGNATRNGFDGDADFKASADSLDINSVAIAKAIGTIYGADAEKRFLEIWRSHVTFFVDYTVASKKDDKPGMEKALANLAGYVDAISDFLSNANPNLPREAVKQLFTEHVALLKSMVDNHAAANYSASYAKQMEADKQAGMISDGLAGAIVKQYPEKF